jgi:hypothetical protein
MNESASKKTWDKPQLGGLYRRKTLNGKSYLGGFLAIPDENGIPGPTTKIVIYANDFKTEDNHPDFRIYLDTPNKDPKKKTETKPEVNNKVKSESGVKIDDTSETPEDII